MLYAAGVSTGGEVVTQKSNLLSQAGLASYMGGCTLTFALADTSGLIRASGTFSKMRRVRYSLGEGKTAGIQAMDLSVDEEDREVKAIGLGLGQQVAAIAVLVLALVLIAAIF